MQVVEYCEAAICERSAEPSWLYAAGGAVKQTGAQRPFEICDRLGDDRVRNREAVCSFRQASGLRHCEQRAQVPELDAAKNSIDVLHRAKAEQLYLCRRIELFT